MGALNTYLTLTRRLLHDASAQFWANPELTDDINAARTRVAADTKCLRQLVTSVNLTAGKELYNVVSTLNTGIDATTGTTFTNGIYVAEVMSVTIYWGTTTRIVCQNRPFTEQNAKLRSYTNYQQRPGSIARMGTNYLYINPVPNQAYVSDWDCVVTPVPLALDTTPEVLPVAMQTPVPYYAAHVAKYNEQSYEESEIFYKKYWEELRASAWAVTSTRTRDAYRR